MVLNLGKNNDKLLEIDEESKVFNIFLKEILFNKEKIEETQFNNILNKIKQNEQNLFKFMSVLIKTVKYLEYVTWQYLLLKKQFISQKIIFI